MQTINCTNPNCGNTITVPTGASFVTCPACDTWHMLDNAPSPTPAQSLSPSFDAGDYFTPPQENKDPAPPSYDPSPAIAPYPPIVEPPPVPKHEGADILPDYPPTGDITPPPPSSENEPIAFLQTINGKRLILKEGKNYIGRQGTDLIIQDKTVSRRHCVIEVIRSEGQHWNYYICDIGFLEGKASSNGVLVSGRSLRLENHERLPIQVGSSIQLGNVYLILQRN